MVSTQKELIHMQIRLFRMACKRWQLDNHACADIFDRYGLDDYIEISHGIFHVQGDDANFADLTEYARMKGAKV